MLEKLGSAFKFITEKTTVTPTDQVSNIEVRGASRPDDDKVDEFRMPGLAAAMKLVEDTKQSNQENNIEVRGASKTDGYKGDWSRIPVLAAARELGKYTIGLVAGTKEVENKRKVTVAKPLSERAGLAAMKPHDLASIKRIGPIRYKVDDVDKLDDNGLMSAFQEAKDFIEKKSGNANWTGFGKALKEVERKEADKNPSLKGADNKIDAEIYANKKDLVKLLMIAREVVRKAPQYDKKTSVDLFRSASTSKGLWDDIKKRESRNWEL